MEVMTGMGLVVACLLHSALCRYLHILYIIHDVIHHTVPHSKWNPHHVSHIQMHSVPHGFGIYDFAPHTPIISSRAYYGRCRENGFCGCPRGHLCMVNDSHSLLGSNSAQRVMAIYGTLTCTVGSLTSSGSHHNFYWKKKAFETLWILGKKIFFYINTAGYDGKRNVEELSRRR